MIEKRFQVDWESVNATLNKALRNMCKAVEEEEDE